MIFDELITFASARAAGVIDDSLQVEKCPDHVFSEKFEDSIKELLDNWKSPKKHPILRKVLLVAAVIIAIFGLLMAYSPKIRASVWSWMRSLFGPYVTYKYEGSEETPSEIRYELGWVPEGYVLVNEEHDFAGGYYDYINDKKNIMISFDYSYSDPATVLYIDPESAVSKNIKINGDDAELFAAMDEHEASLIVWFDDKTKTLFEVSGIEDERVLIKMASSVIEVD